MIKMCAAFSLFLLYCSFVSAKLRFASIGDWGTGTKTQAKVAGKLKEIVQNERVTFLVSPGSNFEYGVSGISDDKWISQFENIYNDDSGIMDIPMFTVLGSGDWQGDYNSQINRSQQIYLNGQTITVNEEGKKTNGLPRLIMPNWWYHYFTHFATNASVSLLKSGHKDMSVGFIFIDTWILSHAFPFKDVTDSAWNELKTTLEIAPKIVDYIIVVGDKPIISSGASKGDSNLAYHLLPLLKEAQVDAYIAGHDHDMEFIDYQDISLIVCGSGGAKGRKALLKSSYSKFFSDAPGFCLHELDADGFTTKFIDGETGQVIFSHTRAPKERKQRQFGNEIQQISKLPDVILHPVGFFGNVTHKDTFTRIVGTIGIIIALVHVVLATSTTLGKSVN
ncbi:acid phosphatase protein, putative [Theileria equi strain WA]|uniref:Acid phosphatase protein, putative n=1 Tax=Theileria equi strain WA TaxID=1537102 RepID=L1LDC0_THEEQ|nr:acid phosphatase protein, putative [Theileria equi strain WA]XP_004832894.1 acid phosphatase protein, putative [Theileria equi strain WA]EKX72625.1 acid phosphatase protein, putative [Theileria equi strain WA]EKX73442.1 acid phosphatase protein, putative [Theileria equi strain WA]|eukprot:XP_004832077.1 acid phosphatase protein, putative [Theileria equi strain WA]